MQKSIADHEQTTIKVFIRAYYYYVAMQNRPFSDHDDLIKLQEINGVNLGKILHSRYFATNIINHISNIMSYNSYVIHIRISYPLYNIVYGFTITTTSG